MVTDLIHRLGIAAPPAEKIYRALTTEEGIKSWWTTDVKMEAHVGGKAVFGFENRLVEFQMRIEQLTPPTHVRWQCLAPPRRIGLERPRNSGSNRRPTAKCW